MATYAAWPLSALVASFLTAAALITVVGWRLTRAADRLSDVTGLGEAVFGAVLLGGSTSLPGIVTSVVTAWEGLAQFSVSNAVGGIAAQTTFLAIADMSYRRINLEHAAASVENLVQSALLSTLLSIPLLAQASPPVTVFGIHPATPILVGAYLFGLNLVAGARSERLWRPLQTPETRQDEPGEEILSRLQKWGLWLRFVCYALTVAVAGYVVAKTGVELSERTGISHTVVGALFTAIATSMPELVTSVAAVRQGALTLAVGGIIGGNSFDVLFLAFSDIAYREGSIYHAVTDRQSFLIALTIALTGILLLGLLRREKKGVGNIGFESFLVLLLYVGAMVLLVSGG